MQIIPKRGTVPSGDRKSFTSLDSASSSRGDPVTATNAFSSSTFHPHKLLEELVVVRDGIPNTFCARATVILDS